MATITTPTTIDELLDYWPGDIPFKGQLVSDDGCMCAQGQALHFLDGLTINELRKIDQAMADKMVARLFGISLAHSILLRIVNDSQKGAPSCVIRNPEQVLGNQAEVVLAFWRHVDRMTPEAWKATRKAFREAAWQAAALGAAKEAAEEAAEKASWKKAKENAELAAEAAAEAAEAARVVAWGVASEVASLASNEIQGAAVMRVNNQPFFFLPLFGFSDPGAVLAAGLCDFRHG